MTRKISHRSQAARRHKESDSGGEIAPVQSEGTDAQGWPDGYVESFTGISEDFVRPPQGELEKRQKIDVSR
jgi:hypothetical protein